MTNLLLLFDAPALLVQVLLDGILVGSIFALAAYGMALVWGVMNIINVTQGEFVVLGTFCPWCAISAVSITVITGLSIFLWREATRRTTG